MKRKEREERGGGLLSSFWGGGGKGGFRSFLGYLVAGVLAVFSFMVILVFLALSSPQFSHLPPSSPPSAPPLTPARHPRKVFLVLQVYYQLLKRRRSFFIPSVSGGSANEVIELGAKIVDCVDH